jgi:hypothetical protein
MTTTDILNGIDALTDKWASERVDRFAHLRPEDLERLDNMTARRGVDRNALIVQAVDALLAQEAWNGGFIAPPAPTNVPRRTRDRGRMKRQARQKWKMP